MLKLYEFECEWVAAHSQKEAAKVCKDFYGDPDYPADEDEAKLVTKNRMDSLVYYDDIECKSSSDSRSFQQQFNDMGLAKPGAKPQFFAMGEC